MSYFPTDIPFMSDNELIKNGLKPRKKPEKVIDYCATCENFIENDPCDVCMGTEENHVYYTPDFVKTEEKKNEGQNRKP